MRYPSNMLETSTTRTHCLMISTRQVTDPCLTHFPSLITLLSSTGTMVDSELRSRTVKTLLAYSGLLHYSGLDHESLSAVADTHHPPTAGRALGSFFGRLSKAILHPKFILFLPAFVIHTPAYVSAYLAGRFLATPALPETVAILKVIVGGLGLGFAYGGVAVALTHMLLSLGSTTRLPNIGWHFLQQQIAALQKVGLGLTGVMGPWGRVRSVFATTALAYATIRLLSLWHRSLVRGRKVLYQFDQLLMRTAPSITRKPPTVRSSAALQLPY